jgi:hypothetical protein
VFYLEPMGDPMGSLSLSTRKAAEKELPDAGPARCDLRSYG